MTSRQVGPAPSNAADAATKVYVDSADSALSAVTGYSLVNVSTITTLGGSAKVTYIVLVASGGTPTLPTASSNTSLYSIKNIDTVNHNIATTSSQTIEGTAGPITITPNQALTLVSDGTNWRIV